MKTFARALLGLSILTALTIAIIYNIPTKPSLVVENSPYDPETGSHGKKKLLIFTSTGGGGHLSVSNALKEYLRDDYIIGTTDMFCDVLAPIDPIRGMFQNKYTGVDFYNDLIKKKWHMLLNINYDFGSWVYNFNRKKIKNLLENYLIKYRPDLIISVIPVVNKHLLQVAKKLNIPFLLIPTDLDPSIALDRIKNPAYDKFYLALAYNDQDINNKVKEHRIPESQISYVGFPVKKEFYDPYHARGIKKEFGIIENKPVVLLLMGAQGSTELIDFARQFTKVTIPIHLVIAIGRSENLRQTLERLPFPKNVTHSVIGFTHKIPQLMHSVDLLISKSGSVSVNEAIYAKLPIYLDSTSTNLNWEKLNHTFVVSHGFGGLIKKYYAIPNIIHTVFENNKQVLKKLKNNLNEFEKKNPTEEIPLLIKQILKEQSISR